MLTLLALEFRKLSGARSVRLAVLVCLLLPWLWSLAPRLQQIYGLTLVSGFQVPALALITTVQFVLPLFVALSCAELIGTEVAQGTLAPLLLRPLDRNRVILAKLLAALLYPALLLVVLLIGSLLAGLRLGYTDFAGGSGLGPGGFVGQGLLSSGAALLQVLRGYLLAAVVMLPVSALSLLFGVTFLNTTAAALATLATLNIMRLLTVFPEAIQKILLTTHLDLFLRQGSDIVQPMILLLIYTVGFGVMAVFAFDRRDV
ncbi:ABC transporter permease [Deinococcus sonorensis]|uniref:ABC transporter permease n=2 Tax=Deinococcus sonorensis TaxID=309891 RepID=A0AAU7UCL5_9DEIO